ncbi:MAG: hypothetical protein UY21_C0013G0002 [Microgenomates group bacterium GW2011_GWA1_48_10]|uniref:HIT domain-containing protein n=1 Tax=Candidatus Gottesmanbacteria bacterium RIFCSPHIGHO2_01_FULL_47_48 TaxID=1798381 RepID=A0A1F6A526_9BACT|nr:MAG: hypothetical protein UY21_C0013G0002 [Microgenomates group bacterium GW2011_GWA1_48_10]OGG19594.1 MAG: hypothetical protein A2721_02885 [Candidatus Gottesmanbacteria bacterium RIFCSPHIGHO2_01_FULL_47_48]
MSDENPLVDPRYAKSPNYAAALEASSRKNVCPLCTLEWHTNPILKEQDDWLITRTTQPYKDIQGHDAEHHFLLIPRRHIEQLTELVVVDWVALTSLIKWSLTEFSIPGGGIAMRFGPTSYTGATVKHLHIHLIVPNTENGQAVPINFPFG